jgi:hypothetical protein
LQLKIAGSNRQTEHRVLARTKALRFLFGAKKEAANLPDQPISVGEYIAEFVAAQRPIWNDPDWCFSYPLSGKFGGDGDWSRAWLVTK